MRILTLIFSIFSTFLHLVAAQDTLGLASGYHTLTSSNLTIKITNSSQILASIIANSAPTFEFSPFDFLANRSANGNYHLGDITLRYRTTDSTSQPWTDVSSASARQPVTNIPMESLAVLASDLSPTLPADAPFQIMREWGVDGGDVMLMFTIKNKGNEEIEIGGLGMPIEFNSIFTSRTAEETMEKCSLTDPNIGMAGGYVRVSPLKGTGPALVVTPLGNSPLEGWRFLSEDGSTPLYYQSQTFEGFYSWEVHTLGYATQEWSSTDPWNEPTSALLSPNQTITHGLRFSLSPSIQAIESTARSTNTPLAIGIPGYIIPSDTTAQLHLYHSSPITSITTSPPDSFNITPLSNSSSGSVYTLTPSPSSWGRIRLSITYAPNTTQTISYFITHPGPQVLANHGSFLASHQLFNSSSDPFNRPPSVITYDRSTNTQVLQDPRVWIAGLSDEGGAGSWLAFAMKQAHSPNQHEISILEDFLNQTMVGVIQPPNSLAVRKSVFYYQPNETDYQYSDAIDWSSWASWNLQEAYATDRAYDYVHVSAAFWAMYRVARYYPDTLKRGVGWEWYLRRAYGTVMYCMGSDATHSQAGYSELGLMGETVWGKLLQDLKDEGFVDEAGVLEARMKIRATAWAGEAVPYGSEMAWDSTGQEGVYYWTDYFGLADAAVKTIDSILGYMPTVSHWGWNGNARRYWDFLYAGKLERIERMLHHYGSGLNALPLLEYFKRNPTDMYALRVGYGGNMGPMSNVDQDGFAALAYHSWPDTMAWDAYSGDYGPNFLGHTLGAGTYVIDDVDLGLVALGGEVVRNENGTVTVVTKDTVRRTVYLAMFGTEITVDAGNIEMVQYAADGSSVMVTVTPSIASVQSMVLAKSTVLKVQKLAQGSIAGSPVVTEPSAASMERGGWVLDLSKGTSMVEIKF